MMSSWPIDDDGTVSIPHEETMLLRSAFDLFDADKSGALDYSEVSWGPHPLLNHVEYHAQDC